MGVNMELTKNQVKITKGVAILFMLLLHLFCTKNYEGLYSPILFIGEVPLMYYLALFGDCCVAIYCFCSGYGLFISYKNNMEKYLKNNFIRIFKLYINYWIILIIFVLIIGPLIGMGNSYPGTFKKFILSFTAIEPAYNGAWWFLTTYIILVLISQFTNKLVNKYNNIAIIFLSLVFYFVAYIQRIKGVVVLNNEILDWGISLVAHGIVQSLFVAAFTGIVFICVFNLMDKPKWIISTLNYLGNHSTNMWLIHMFFYSIYFRQLIWSVKYSLFIYSLLVVLCVASSYIINLIYNPIIIAINKKIKNQKVNMQINEIL